MAAAWGVLAGSANAMAGTNANDRILQGGVTGAVVCVTQAAATGQVAAATGAVVSITQAAFTVTNAAATVTGRVASVAFSTSAATGKVAAAKAHSASPTGSKRAAATTGKGADAAPRRAGTGKAPRTAAVARARSVSHTVTGTVHGATGTVQTATGIVANVMTPIGDALSLSLWNNPAFQKRFMGIYGVNSEIEPRVTVVEKELLEKVMALMKRDKAGIVQARLMLAKAIGPTTSATLDFTLASIYSQQGYMTAAIRSYAKAIDKFPDFQRAHKSLGIARARAGNYEGAIKPLTRAIELGSNDGTTYGLLAYAYLMTEQCSAADGAYRLAMMLQPEVVDWKLGLARCLFKETKYDEAATLCGELIRRDPGRSDYWLLQANAYLGQKQPMRAAMDYEYLNQRGMLTPELLNSLGDIYVNEGLLDVAADVYIEALERAPQGGDPKRGLRNGEVLAARGAAADATRLLARIKVVFGDRLGLEERKRLLKLEARLAAASGEAGETQIALLNEIVSLDPLDGDALILLGQYFAAAKNVEKACFFFERAAGIEKVEAEARLRHAQLLVRNGRYADALPLLKRSQELRPRDDVARYIEQVERAAKSRG